MRRGIDNAADFTRQVTDTVGSITDSHAFAAFGELEGSSGFTLNDYLYTGEQFDQNLGPTFVTIK